MKSNNQTGEGKANSARRIVALLCIYPLWNCASAASLGALVVFSDADDYKFLTGVLSAANVGGWLWWVRGSLLQIRDTIEKWVEETRTPHPGFRLAGLVSLSVSVSWIGVLFLLAYGMLA